MMSVKKKKPGIFQRLFSSKSYSSEEEDAVVVSRKKDVLSEDSDDHDKKNKKKKDRRPSDRSGNHGHRHPSDGRDDLDDDYHHKDKEGK